MQETRQDLPPWPGPRPSERRAQEPRTRERHTPGPQTRARQAAGSALLAADIAIGIGGEAVGFARSVFRAGRPLLGTVVSPLTSAVRTAAPNADRIGQAWPQPWLRQAWPQQAWARPGWHQARLRQHATRGRQDRETLTSAVAGLVLDRVPGVASALLDQLDLTAIVAERVDINAVATKVDVDAIARRIDLIAILERLDPDAVTRYLIERLDLPDIIASSTGSIMTDTVHDVRMLSISADKRLSNAVDAILLRRRASRRLT